MAANVGAIVEPTSRSSYRNKSALLPADLFSHSHQQEFWQSVTSKKRSVNTSGWGGRMMDMLISANTVQDKPAMFSLAGNKAWQKGNKSSDLVLNTTNGVKQINAFINEGTSTIRSSRASAWKQILTNKDPSLLNQFMSSSYTRSEEQINYFINKIANATNITTPFPVNNSLAPQLKMVAKMISIREQLGMKRQMFFVSIGGWDTHDKQLNDHATQLTKLNDALSSFYKTTEELGVADSVTTFTASEFGRTFSINGDGTDHAWAGHNLIMGAAVNGGYIHGDLPDLVMGGVDDADDTGRFIPKYSIDQYGSTLAKWMGMSNSDINDIFPNLKNFDGKDLGFMS